MQADDRAPGGSHLDPANASGPGADPPTDRGALPPEPGTVPHPGEPDPAPERDEDPGIEDPRDRGGTGQPVGADNIREGRVGGVMAPPGSTHGQGQGG